MSTSGNILENLRKKYQQEYGVAVFEIKIKNTKSGVEINGKVLTENQRDEVLDEFKKNKINIKKENIKVLSNAEKRNEIGWAIVMKKIIDLKSRFVSCKIINGKILNRIRCSQAFKGEVLRVLHKYENQLLVQQSDLTLGWVDKKDVIIKKKSLYKKWIRQYYILVYGTKGKILIAGIDGNKIIKEAEKYLGVKYVLGGKSKNGIDCSGLVQVAYKNSLGIILPKHSWDQKEMGIKIDLENIKTGDLVFLIKKKNGHKHIGIAEIIADKTPPSPLIKGANGINPPSPPYQGGANLIHASLNKKKVVRQSLEEVLRSYDFVEARRVAE